MLTPRAAAIHDMSGFGRCSLTVALPILSAMGVQCCPLPTAFLSTHTGGFEGFTFLDMTDELPKVAAHWKSLDLRFQAIYSGFLGSERQIGIVADFIRNFRREDTVVVVDPVMGDHGKVYQTYTSAMCDGTACHIRGSINLAGGITRLLGIQAGETSADGLFSLELVNCLGSCALAPVMVVDGTYYGKVTMEKLPEILNQYREEAAQ